MTNKKDDSSAASVFNRLIGCMILLMLGLSAFNLAGDSVARWAGLGLVIAGIYLSWKPAQTLSKFETKSSADALNNEDPHHE